MKAGTDDTDKFCKCRDCRYANTSKCKVIEGIYSKIAYCRGPYRKLE